MFRVFVTNLGKYTEGHLIGQWLELPCADEEIDGVLEDIGINEHYEEYFITDYETDIHGLEIDEFEYIYKLNEKAEIIEDLHECDKEKLCAILEHDSDYFRDIEDTISKLDDIYLYSGVEDETDLGYYLVDNGLFSVDIPDTLKDYINYEAIGRERTFSVSGGFTNYGFLEVC